MAANKIYLDVSPELRRLLDDGGLTVADVLRQERVEVPLGIHTCLSVTKPRRCDPVTYN